MTISEVVVASVVLSLSAQLGLQSWTATARAADRTASEMAVAVQLDQQVLASQRLLTAGEGSGLLLQEGQPCRLDPVAIDQLLDDALPAIPGLKRELVTAPDLEGVWLVWQGSSMHDQLPMHDQQPWQRRRLLTPAGLGLCGAQS